MLPRPLRSTLALVALLPAAVSAQTNTFSDGTIFNSPVLTGAATTGSMMTGMVVSWEFLGGGGGSGVWGLLYGTTYGVAFGTPESYFSVELGGGTNTFNGGVWGVFNYSGQTISAIQFNGAPGRTVFDCDWNGAACANNGNAAEVEGTSNSENGWSLTNGTAAIDNYTGPVFGFYSNRVGIAGASPVGDVYEQLRIVFGTEGLGNFKRYRFSADTDNSDFNSPIPTPTDVVPEPATMTLLATGLAGMAAARRRKRAS